jgi:hypothetical protein
MNKKQLINTVLELDTCDLLVLTWYRMIFDKPNDIVDLACDIHELYEFPERLVESYQHEWRVYIRKAISTSLPNGVITASDILNCVSQHESAIHFSLTAQHTILNTVEHILTSSDILSPFPTPKRQYIENLLKSS